MCSRKEPEPKRGQTHRLGALLENRHCSHSILLWKGKRMVPRTAPFVCLLHQPRLNPACNECLEQAIVQFHLSHERRWASSRLHIEAFREFLTWIIATIPQEPFQLVPGDLLVRKEEDTFYVIYSLFAPASTGSLACFPVEQAQEVRTWLQDHQVRWLGHGRPTHYRRPNRDALTGYYRPASPLPHPPESGPDASEQRS
jgi:hypothetical protein